MKKFLILIILIATIFVTGCDKQGNITGSYRAKDLIIMIDKIYEKIGEDNMPATSTEEIDIKNADKLKYYTGLSSNEDIDLVVASDALINAQAYSFVLVKVKNNSDVEKVKKEIYDNIDTRKWICVEAESLYVNNYDTIISIVMADKELSNKLYDEFVRYTSNNVGEKLFREMEI